MGKDGHVRRAMSMAQPARQLARRAAEVERREDAEARQKVGSQATADIMAMVAPATQPQNSTSRKALPALLIINSKSGPKRDSLLHVGELVDLLAGHGIAADVRVKLHKSQARREARAATKAGYPLVVAAGGDGTVSAVARGLVGSKTVLGVIPLGTYNNVATSLGIPTDVGQACALIAAAPVRAIDVGEVYARGMKRPRVFLEVGAVGVAGPLAIASQGFEKGRWDAVTKHLPHVVEMTPAVLGVRLDGQRTVHRALSLLAIVANTPRAGAGIVLAPVAKLDDGLLDVCVYEEMDQPILATHFLAVKVGTARPDARLRCWRGRKLVIRSTVPLPVLVDSKVVGSTPVRFRVRPGRLLVIAGSGDGLSHPATQSLVSAIKDHSDAPWSKEGTGQASEVSDPPATMRSGGVQLANLAGPLGIALGTGAAVAIMPVLSRWIDRRRHPHGHFLARLLP
jgi:diacylglycerol kinase (ATP)